MELLKSKGVNVRLLTVLSNEHVTVDGSLAVMGTGVLRSLSVCCEHRCGVVAHASWWAVLFASPDP